MVEIGNKSAPSDHEFSPLQDVPVSYVHNILYVHCTYIYFFSKEIYAENSSTVLLLCLVHTYIKHSTGKKWLS